MFFRPFYVRSGLIVAFPTRETLASVSIRQQKESPHESRA
jgi:hypothetical protein